MKHLRLLVVGVAAALQGPPLLAAPITFNTALPITQGEGIFRVQMKHMVFRGLAGSNLEVDAVPLVVVWGATAKLTLFGITPLLDKQLKLDMPAGRISRGEFGLGDLTLLARYTLWQHDSRGATFRIAPFLGVETPTGRDDAKDALGVLPQPLQLGSGTWDPLLGLVVTRQTLGWELDGSISYQANTEANDFEIGDVARFDLSYQHRMLPRELGAGVPAFLYAVLESNVVWQERHRAGGLEVLDSGGATWYLAPGIQHVRKRLILEATIQIPVVQNLHGNARESEWTGTLSTRVNF